MVHITEPKDYHKPIELRIGWYPYDEVGMIKTGINTWKMVSDSCCKQGNIPILLIRNAESEETLWLNMDIDDALLGKLIKQSLMTEVPLSGPLSEFIEKTDCMTCHPQEIQIK
jgi:hypothetical protein